MQRSAFFSLSRIVSCALAYGVLSNALVGELANESSDAPAS